MNKIFYTINDVAELLDCSLQTVRNLISAGILNAKVHSQLTRISKEDVDKYIDLLKPAAMDADVVMTKAKALNAERRKVEEELEQNRKDVLMIAGLKGSIIRHFSEALMGIMELVYDDDSSREIGLFRRYVHGDSLMAIADEHGLTRERVRQLVEKGCLKAVEHCRDYPKIVNENRMLKEKIQLLEGEIVNKTALMRELIKIKDSQEPDLKDCDATETGRMLVLLNTPVRDLDFSVRALNCLCAADIQYVWQLVSVKKEFLLQFRNFGKKTLYEIDCFLETYGLSFDMKVDKYMEFLIKP